MSRDRTVGDTFYMLFTTRAFATGIPTVLAGTPIVSAYEDNSITQITAGVTLGVDHDGVVGLNLLTIVATGGNGFESGKDYSLVITTGTVGGVSVVGEVVGDFSLNLSAAAVDLANGTDGLGAIKADTAATLTDTTEIGVAGAGLTAINLPNQTMDIVGNITGNLSGSVGSVTGGATSVELAKVPKSDSTVTWNATALASINAECDTAIIDAALATAANLAIVDSNVDSILVDTGTTIPAQITVLNDFDPATEAVANVTLVATTTTNADMRGTDSALLASSAPTNFSDLSISVTTGLVDITQTAADKVWSTTARTLTAFSFTVDCDVQLINGATVLGNGTSGNLWRG